MTAKDRKARERERKRAQGFRPGEVWAHADDWPKLRKYIEKLNRRRSEQESESEQAKNPD